MTEGAEAMGPRPRLTIVIPAKNEEATIAETIQGVAVYGDKVIVVDGHSRDRTREIAAACGARVELDAGLGKGDAIRLGLARAHGEIVVFIDADGSHDPRDIPTLVAPIIAGEADLVIGCRFMGGSDELYGTFSNFVRLTGSLIINFVVNWRWGVRLTDIQNGFRAIRKSVGERLDLLERKPTIEQEMVMKCLKGGFRVQNVASHEFARRFGESRIPVWRWWPAFVWCVLKNLV